MRVKILAGLCALFFLIASVEAVLLIRSHWEQKRLSARDPFRIMHQIHAADPWSGFHDKFFRDFDDDPFLKDFGRGFFDKFRRKHLGADTDNGFEQGFGATFSFKEPKWEEHGKEMHMVLDIKGHEQGDYSVNVSDEQVTLTSKDKQIKDDDGMKQESHWSNMQSFPLPPEVDPKDFRVERTQDKFIVIFKKRDSSRSST